MASGANAAENFNNMLTHRHIESSIHLFNYGTAENGRMGNRGFISLGELRIAAKISRSGIILLRKPRNRQEEPKFELNREQAHMFRHGKYNYLPPHIRFRRPRPTCSQMSDIQAYRWKYVSERIEPVPKNVRPN